MLQSQFIYFPEPMSPTEPKVWGADGMQTVQLHTEDQLILTAWYAPPNQSTQPVLVYFHGNAGHIGGRVPTVIPYVQAGYGVLLVEYRGYGNNPGKPSEQGLYQDGRAAIHYLNAQQAIPTERMVLYGESLGSGVAVQLATEMRVKAVVLQAPFTSLVAVGKLHYPYLPIDLLLTDRYESLQKIAQIQAPLIIVHGDADDIVPIALGQQLYEQAVEPKHALFLPGVGHNNIPDVSVRVVQTIAAIPNGPEAAE